ncbi:unnamed protein product [Closterium sp. NIES-64]|nr:unnamed protein product [Closterium sp. NIES-64]
MSLPSIPTRPPRPPPPSPPSRAPLLRSSPLFPPVRTVDSQQLSTPLLKVVGAGGARPAQGGAELVVRGSAVGITSRQLLPGLREVLREVLREMLTHDKVLENLAAPIRTNANRTALQKAMCDKQGV